MPSPQNLTQKLISSHLEWGALEPGAEIGLHVDQTLTQDATGTLVMLALEALGLDRVKTEVSAQYVDHNLIQADHKNPDDHLFLASACRRFGIEFCAPGGGVSHPVHMQRLGIPGKSLLGSDSHTCAGGALGMLAIGAGGLDVALAMAGEPYVVPMPEVWNVQLVGELDEWVSAKDVILELLRRHGVSGGVGRVIEYSGPGLVGLSAMDRHVIANMGAELGATTSVFPSDLRTEEFLSAQGRGEDFRALAADDGASYDYTETIELSEVEPLIAKPSSPGNVVPVSDVVGEPVYQGYIGSSANPGYRDFAIAAAMVRGKHTPPTVSFDVNPTSRRLLLMLIRSGLLADLIGAGARVHQTGCNGCIGMGQAPATGTNSLRTTPRNFPGRSGTREDRVWLCSPETATASALAGKITDPRELGRQWFDLEAPRGPLLAEDPYRHPPTSGADEPLEKGPNIGSMPTLDPLPKRLEVRVLLSLPADVSTDEILPAGTRVLPYRSNIDKIADFCFEPYETKDGRSYAEAARELRSHAVVAGENYGQGSSREHAALAPRHLGLRLVLATSLSRIHRANLINYGVLPLLFKAPEDKDAVSEGDTLGLDTARLAPDRDAAIEVAGKKTLRVAHDLSERELEVIFAGGRIAEVRNRVTADRT